MEKTIDNYLHSAFNIYSNRFKSILFLTLAFYVPFYIVFFVLNTTIAQQYVGTIAFYGLDIQKSVIISLFILTVLNMTVSPLFMGSIYMLVNDSFIKEKLVPKEIFFKILKLSPIIIIASFLNYFLVMAGTLLIILGPYFLIIFYFYVFQICEGEKNPIRALKKSKDSVKGKFLITFAIIFLTSVLDSLVTQLFFSVARFSGAPNNVFYNTFYNIISAIISSYFFIFLALWYRTRILGIKQSEV